MKGLELVIPSNPYNKCLSYPIYYLTIYGALFQHLLEHWCKCQAESYRSPLLTPLGRLFDSETCCDTCHHLK